MGDDSYSEDVYSEFEEDAMVHEPQMIDTRPAWTQREESEPGERELRSHLYAQLKNSGVIGNVKSQLRAQLLAQLKRGKVIQLSPAPGDRPSLKRRALNHLIASYLAACPYSYSLTVFKEEAACGGSQEAGPSTLLSEDEVMDVFGIDPQSFLATAISAHRGSSAEKGGQSFLLGLMHALGELTDSKLGGVKPGPTTVNETESRLDQSYRSLKVKEPVGWLQGQVEARMAAYRQEIEEQSKSEVERQVSRVRDVEIAAVRLEEAMKHRKSSESERLELDRMHQDRLSKLRQREEDLMDKLRQQQRDVESVAYEHRQKILREEERIRSFKEEVQQQLDARGTQLKNIEKTIEMRERAVTAREAAAERKIAEATEAASSSAVTVRQQVEREYLDLKASVNAQRMQLEMDRARIMELRSEAASELAGARVREDRIRSLESARQEAEARAAAHAADAEILRLQCEKLYHELQQSRDELSRKIHLATDSADAMLQNAAGALSMLDAEANASRGMTLQVREAQKDAFEAREAALAAKSAKEAAEASLLASTAKASKLEAEVKALKETLKSLEAILDEAVEGRNEALVRLRENEEESKVHIYNLEQDLEDLRARALRYHEELTAIKMQLAVQPPPNPSSLQPMLQARGGLLIPPGPASSLRVPPHPGGYPYAQKAASGMMRPPSPLKTLIASPQRPSIPMQQTMHSPVADRFDDLSRRDRQMQNELMGFRERVSRQAHMSGLEVNGALARVQALNTAQQGGQLQVSAPSWMSQAVVEAVLPSPPPQTLIPAPTPTSVISQPSQGPAPQPLALIQPSIIAAPSPPLNPPPPPTLVSAEAAPVIEQEKGLTLAPPPGLTLAPPPGLTLSPPPGLTLAPPPGLMLAPPPGLTLAPPPGLNLAPSQPSGFLPPAEPSPPIPVVAPAPQPEPVPTPQFLPPGLSMVSTFKSSSSSADPPPPPPPPGLTLAPPAPPPTVVEAEPPRQFIAQPTANDLQSIILAKRKALEEERKRRLAEQEKEREREEAEERERELKRQLEEQAAEGQDESPTPPPKSSQGGSVKGVTKAVQPLRPPKGSKPKSKPPSDAGSLADLEVSMGIDEDEDEGDHRASVKPAGNIARPSHDDQESSNGGDDVFEVGGGSTRGAAQVVDAGGDSDSLPDYDINVGSSEGGSIRAPPSEGSVF